MFALVAENNLYDPRGSSWVIRCGISSLQGNIKDLS